MGAISITSGRNSTTTPAVRSDLTCRTDRSFVHAIMRKARGWFRHKPSIELAEIMGVPERTARRYFAGERTPDAVNLMALLRSPYGARLVIEATNGLPPRAYREFWREMGMAALRAQHREDLGID